jgi:hypothetical protein
MEELLKDEVITQQQEWLSSLILCNGEFIMYDIPSNNFYKLNPYFASIAGLSLAHNPKYFHLIKRYLKWYISHLNLPDKFGENGTVYDYFVKSNHELISTYDYDSYDSYPAVFLSLCIKYLEFSKDYDFFTYNSQKLDLIVNSLINTFDKDFLTFAKPNYKVKYLMDNCEVKAGLKDAISLYEMAYKDSSLLDKLKYYYINNSESIEKLFWNNEFYYYEIDSLGKKYYPNNKKFYPDASSQLFVLLHNIIDCNSQRAKNIYNNFVLNFPDIESLEASDDFPNVYIAYISCIMKDFDRAKEYLIHYYKKYIKNNNVWPWYSVEASYFIRSFLYLCENF